jgi:hypothetical protein
MTTRRNLLIGGGAAVLGLGGAAWAQARATGSMTDYAVSVAKLRSELPPTPAMGDLIRYATLAPSGHNTQPWLFRPAGNQIAILPDLARRTPVVDPDDHHLFVSLGCVAETLAIAAGNTGRAGDMVFVPGGDGSVVFNFGSSTRIEQPLFDAIPHRQSTRAEYDGSLVNASDLRMLAAAAKVPGVDLMLITERSEIDEVRDLVIAGNNAQIDDPAFITELKQWLRFSPNTALRKGDGLFSAASGNPALPEWLGFTAKAEADKYARQIASSAGIAVFFGAEANPSNWVQVGRACQRFSLQATALRLRHAYLNQPVEVPQLRNELAALVGMPGRRPDIVMRFGYGPALPYSARRPVEAVLAR